MANKVNLLSFQDILRRSTLNFSIDNVGMVFDHERFRSGMRDSNAIVIISKPNDIISGISANDTWEMNFSDPSKNVKTYFDLAIPDADDEAGILMKNEKVVLKSSGQSSNLFFCSDHLISKFEGSGPRTNGDSVFELTVTEEFVDVFNLVKKVAGGFGKLYFNVLDNIVSLESTDKTNSFSNGMKMDIGECEYDDISICFDFKTINNVMILLNGDATDFTIRLGHIAGTDSGMVSFIKSDDSEKYYVISKREDV